MKLKKIETSIYPNLELRIGTLYRKKKTFNSKTEIKHAEILLNKIANIVYLYHITGKTILFLGFPSSFNGILKATKHLSVPEFMWQNNMFSCKSSVANKKARVPKNVLKLKTKLRKKVDLIVINNTENNNIAYRESYFARIPAIALTKELEVVKIRLSYHSTGSYNFFAEKEENKNFFFTFIRSVLLRAKKSSNKQFKKKLGSKSPRKAIKFSS